MNNRRGGPITSAERAANGHTLRVQFTGSLLAGYVFHATEWRAGEVSEWNGASETITGMLDQIEKRYGVRPATVSAGEIQLTERA